ncbi:MAG: hypothetical protein II938_04260 [Alphaproteobacteria bacterium]|nr:hypothetical protein [Alphaproteobacteria bacterium]
MKKSVLLFAGACLLCSSLAHATCTGGTEYMGKVNTTQRLCMSSASSASFMNWWSAFAWCNANGMRLARYEDVCTGGSMSFVNNSARCGNISSYSAITGIWLADANENGTQALQVGGRCDLGCSIWWSNRSATARAICVDNHD